MNLKNWQPQSDYFKKRRLRAIRWVERTNDEHLRNCGGTDYRRGLPGTAANVEGQARAVQVRGRSGKKALGVRGVSEANAAEM
jgi:hypothetical protein